MKEILVTTGHGLPANAYPRNNWGRFFGGLMVGGVGLLAATFSPNLANAADIVTIAHTGQAGLTRISPYVSINDSGLVALAGETAQGRTAFVGGGGALTAVLAPSQGSGGSMVRDRVHINNLNQVLMLRGTFLITTEPVIYYSPWGPIVVAPGSMDTLDFLQFWPADGSGSPDTVAKAWIKREYDIISYPPRKLGLFWSLGPDFCANNRGQVAFMADQGTEDAPEHALFTKETATDYVYLPLWSGTRPALADDGSIVVRTGQAASEPIVRLDYLMSDVALIAGPSLGLTALGAAPGISDDGRYVAFYGVLNEAGAASLGTAPGPGIFLHHPAVRGPALTRVAGPPSAGGPLAFDPDQRVVVNAQQDADEVLIAFLGTDAVGRKAVYCSWFYANPGDASAGIPPSETVLPPRPLARQSESINGLGPFDGFRLYDSLNTRRQVAFYATGGSSEAVFRATAAPEALELSVLDANPMFLGGTLLPTSALEQVNWEALANASVERSRAVADGVTRLLLRCETSGPGTVTFEQRGPAEGRLLGVLTDTLSVDDQPTRIVNDRHFAFALYVVPEGVPLKQGADPDTPLPVPVSFTASFVPERNPTPSIEAREEITLAPTPVLLLHGLWGKRADWRELESDLRGQGISPDLMVRNVDYSAVNAESFRQNTCIVPRESAALLRACRARGFAVSRVDVVAHSMGGILTRIASNLPGYLGDNNFGEGYLRRVITVDTPHHGAPSASFLLHYLGAFSYPDDINWRMGWIDFMHKYPYRGAVRDLAPPSFANSVGGVAGPGCAAMRVPAFTLYCQATDPGDTDWLWEIKAADMWRDDFLSRKLLLRNPRLADLSAVFQTEHRRYNDGEFLAGDTSHINLWRTVFSGQANDGTVAVASQSGRCGKTGLIAGISHVRAPHNRRVREAIIGLLNSPVEGNFDLEGLPPVSQFDLDEQKGWYASNVRSPNPSPASHGPKPEDPDFAFKEPRADSRVRCGEPVVFSFDLTEPERWSDVIVALAAGGEVFDAVAFDRPPFAGSLWCASGALGAAELVAWGRDTNGTVRVGSVRVVVELPSNLTLTAISAEPTAIRLEGLGESETIQVAGEFSDMIRRDLSHASTGTRYTVANTQMVSIDDTGRVTAQAEGETSIEVVHGAFTNRVAVSASFRPPEVLAVWPVSLLSSVRGNVVLGISGLRFGGASKVEVLGDGRPAQGVEVTNLNVVTEGFMTAELSIGQEAQPGRYEVVVTTTGGRSDTIKNKGAQFTIEGPLRIEAFRDSAGSLGLRVKDALERSFVLESSPDLTAWSSLATNIAVGGTWEANRIPYDTNGRQFFRARVAE